MPTKLFIAAAALMLISSAANTQTSTSSRRCVTNPDGTQTCTTATEGANSTSTMTCKHYGGGASDCSTEYQDRRPSLPTVQEVTVNIADENAKAAARAKAGYRDPGAVVLYCPPGTGMTERDGCQPRR